MICTSWPWERATEVPALESFNGRVLRDSGPRTPCGGGGSRPGARDGRGNVDGPLLALRVRHGYDRSSDPRSRNRPKVPKAQNFQGSRAVAARRAAGGGGGGLNRLLRGLVGESPGIEAVREKIQRLLDRKLGSRHLPPILLDGETGTGKGLVAWLIHRVGPRADGPFVPVNCAAIPETLLESELFGHERGAFTDARQAKPGLFQAAHRGTIFLDEIGLLPEVLQAKLLKVIEERSVRRLGATQSEHVDVWIISATNTDLSAAIATGKFRADLYHRLAVVPLSLPPLRERDDDALLLAEHFLARASADYGLPAKTLTADARAQVLTYSWPGNIRELANTMERAVLLSETPEVSAAVLELRDAPVGALAKTGRPARASPLNDAVHEHLQTVLNENNGNISRTAAVLGITR